MREALEGIAAGTATKLVLPHEQIVELYNACFAISVEGDKSRRSSALWSSLFAGAAGGFGFGCSTPPGTGAGRGEVEHDLDVVTADDAPLAA